MSGSEEEDAPLLGGGGKGEEGEGGEGVAQKVADRLADLVAPGESASLFWREALLYALLVGGTVAYWALATTGVGPEFLLSFAGAMGTLLALHVHNNTGGGDGGGDGDGDGLGQSSAGRQVWGLALAFFLGSLAKVFAVTLDILLYLALRLTAFDMANPHDDRPLSAWEVTLRAAVAAFVLVALVEEAVKLQFLVTFDDSDSRLGRSLNIYHPRGIVLVSVALSLGSCGWSVVPSLYAADHEAPLAYVLWAAAMEVPLHLATGALVGVSVARRMFLGEALSYTRILALPVLVRGLYFFALSLPLRDSPPPPDPFLGDDAASASADDEEAPTALDQFQQEIESVATDVGGLLVLVYLFCLVLVSVAAWHAAVRVERLTEDAADQGALSRARGDGDL